MTIPSEVAHLGKDPPANSGETNMIAELAQMVGMVTASGEAQERLLDELIDYEQMKQSNLLAPFKHLEDGEVP